MKIPNNLGLPSRMWSIIPNALGVGCASWLPFKENCMEKGERSRLTLENSDKHCFNMVIKVNIKSCWQYTPHILMWQKWHFTSVISSTNSRTPQQNQSWEKYQINPNWGPFHNYHKTSHQNTGSKKTQKQNLDSAKMRGAGSLESRILYLAKDSL